MQRAWCAAAAALLILAVAPAAWADDETRGGPMPPEGATPSAQALPRPMSAEGRVSEVAGIRIVPSILAHDVYLRPTAWILRTGGQWANADARVYMNKDGAIIGLTLSAWGLPETTRYGQQDQHYVVWLVNRDSHDVINIGELDAYNAGRAVFGYTPVDPVSGYDAILVTRERQANVAQPSKWQHLEADLPRTAYLPPIGVPEVAPPPKELHPMDERRGNSTGPLKP